MLPGTALFLPQRVLVGAQMQWCQAFLAQEIGVGSVLQQQLRAVRVASLAGLMQSTLASWSHVGVCPPEEQVTHTGSVSISGSDAQWGGQFPLVFQGPQACRAE